MTGQEEANSAKTAEIRARAERIVRDIDEDTTDVALARDVLALIEVAEAARELLAASKYAYVPVGQSFGFKVREQSTKSGAFDAAQARLEEALTRSSVLLGEAR